MTAIVDIPDVDTVVIGAGVIGLAVARALQLSGQACFVLEANATFGLETSARNSEVIHAGIYYPAGSEKARLCVKGKALLYAYCAARGIPHRRTGKLIVATQAEEIPILAQYQAAAQANGVDYLGWVSAAELKALEPDVAGVQALFSPSTGIIDSHAYMKALLDDFETAGGHFVRKAQISSGMVDGTSLLLRTASGDQFRARRVINCAGLGAPDLVKRLEGFPPAHIPRPYYAVGHYYLLQGPSSFRHLIYPVAVAGGLGVHVTLDMAGQVRFGPDVRWIDAVDYRFDDRRRAEFVAAIRAYYPGLDAQALVPGYTGVRPKITGPDAPAGDFLIQGEATHGVPGLINLFGIESPGLTASLAIAERVRGMLIDDFGSR